MFDVSDRAHKTIFVQVPVGTQLFVL